jgi:ArsR family transcriptional regulator, arsenate/arsenite/antimonite-responsive transcriptional repressor
MDIERASALFEALGNPTRLRMVLELARAGRPGLAVAVLQDRVGVGAKSTVSHHLGHLVRAGLVTQERQSTTLVCRAAEGSMDDLASYLIHCLEPNDGQPVDGASRRGGRRAAGPTTA